MKILVACESSGTVRDAFIKKGHNAISCDLLPTESLGPHYQCDVRDILGDDWDLMIAHPVCTRLANSGVRWLDKPPRGKSLSEMWQELDEGAKFYRLFQESEIPKKAIENPIMHKYAKERILMRSRQIIQPWWFGDKAFKATGFELTNLPDLVPTNKLDPPLRGSEEYKRWSKIHYASPGPNRWKIRSRTFQGVADAMAEQWG